MSGGNCGSNKSEKIQIPKILVILTEYIVENLMKQSENEGNHFWYIYKYTNVNNIISDLNYLIGSITGKKNLLKKSSAPNLIGFYSISGGTR